MADDLVAEATDLLKQVILAKVARMPMRSVLADTDGCVALAAEQVRAEIEMARA